MAYRSLNHFIAVLEEQGELVRIKAPVSPTLQMAEITDRMSKQPDGGKALLFENTGTAFPVLTNMMGSARRICTALGADSLDEFGELMRFIMASVLGPKPNLWAKLSVLPELSQIARWMPHVRSGRGACQQVVQQQPKLSNLPVLRCWPHDGGPFITLPLVHTKDPHTGIRNVGMYRMQVLDDGQTAMHWHRHKTGARHLDAHRALGERMPVAVALGGDPAYTYAATAPMPDGMDEYMLAGFIRNRRVELVRCLTVPLEVPADADFVLEGYIDPTEDPMWEGPFGDHTGFYSLPDWYPRFHITCISHRRDAVYPATLVGVPPMEDAHIARATERIFLEPLRTAIAPELVDMHMPAAGTAHNLALVSLRTEAYSGVPLKAMNALWGAGQMMFNKVLVAFGPEVNLLDYPALARHAAARIEPQQHLHFGSGVADVLDHATDQLGLGSKLMLDATGPARFDTAPIDATPIAQAIGQAGGEICGAHTALLPQGIPVVFVLLNRDHSSPRALRTLDTLALHNELAPVLMLVAVDAGLDQQHPALLLWYALANIDPQRDVALRPIEGRPRAMVLVDGTRKLAPADAPQRPWPNVATMDPATIAEVDALWPKLGLGPLIASPSMGLMALQRGLGAEASMYSSTKPNKPAH
ncbi:MAG: menaquinone biosynthesis decarboxylase [Bacteroidales bacterium]|nr:menaquinone biosynthesis decarboxylase [Bacteroidales bacterium]